MFIGISNRWRVRIVASLLCLAVTAACSDELPDSPTTPPPHTPGDKDPPPKGDEEDPSDSPDCEANERWSEDADACVCIDDFTREDGQCVPVPEASACLLISSTDWMTSGSLSIYDVDKDELLDDVTTYHQDSVLRVVDNEVYVLQRHLSDSVLKLDPQDMYRVLWEESVRTDDLWVPNPHDMVRVGNKLYLSFYNDGRIVQANLDPLASGGFLTGLQARIDPPDWDGSFAEVSHLKVVDGILYAVAEGLNDGWNCGSRSAGSPNRSRVYAFYPDTLEPAPVFEHGQSWKELSFCNMRHWFDLPDGRTVISSLGNYRQYGADENDGGIEIIDLRNPTAPPKIVVTEGDFGPYDIFNLMAHEGEIYAALVGEQPIPIYLHRLDTSSSDAWTLDGDALYEGNIWDIKGVGDELFIVERDIGFEGVIRLDRRTGEASAAPLQTAIAPETLTVFRRVGGCW